MAGAEDHDGPDGGEVGLEVEFDGAAAGHADVALERPSDEARGGNFLRKEILREREGLGFDAAAADGAGVKAGGGDEHFGARVLRDAAECLDERDEHERGRGGFEGDELFVERGRGGHGAAEGNQPRMGTDGHG